MFTLEIDRKPPGATYIEELYNITDLQIEDYPRGETVIEEGRSPLYFFDRVISFKRDGKKYMFRLPSEQKRVPDRMSIRMRGGILPMIETRWTYMEDFEAMEKMLHHILSEFDPSKAEELK